MLSSCGTTVTPMNSESLAYGFLARIEQVVGLLAIGTGHGNRVVVTGNGGGQLVDLRVGHRRKLLVDEGVLLALLIVDGVEAFGQATGLRQHQLPCRDVGRVLGGGLQGCNSFCMPGVTPVVLPANNESS